MAKIGVVMMRLLYYFWGQDYRSQEEKENGKNCCPNGCPPDPCGGGCKKENLADFSKMQDFAAEILRKSNERMNKLLQKRQEPINMPDFAGGILNRNK